MEMYILQVMRGHGFADIFVFRYVIINLLSIDWRVLVLGA